MRNRDAIVVLILWGLGGRAAWAGKVSFERRELFRVPFGESRETLGAMRQGEQLVIPRSFTMDEIGHFFVYDSGHHRVARFTSAGKFEMELRYPATAGQVFAHVDQGQNLWIFVSDPERGLFYGVYDTHGKSLRSGQFSQFNTFRLHVDDQSVMHVIVGSTQNPQLAAMYLPDEKTLLLKKEKAAIPQPNHHQLRRNDKTYYVDSVPGGDSRQGLTRISTDAHEPVREIAGTVIYMTPGGDIYTRVGEREIRVYEASGELLGRVLLEGLPASVAAIRFDRDGNIYEMDGIPVDGAYTGAMAGMRFIQYERH